MKSQKILLAAALLALGAASCQKEEKVITQFTAGMEQSSAKTYLDGQLLKWVSGDQVKVYSNGANGSDFAVTPRADNGTWAVLSGTIAGGSSYTAIYPASIAASATSVTLPAVQNSADGSLAGFPMYAESSTDEFQFKNLCGALRIHLEQANCTISRIKVTAGSAINGTYTVSTTTEGIPQLGTCTNGTATTTLILDNAQSVRGDGDEGRDFYVYLPAGEYSNMQLTFYQPDGTICTKSGSVTVERSKCTPVTISGGLTFSLASNEIWYTTSNGQALNISTWNDNTVISDSYQNGRGVITFDSPVTSVPYRAFSDQSNLTSVTLPASVESIGEQAFWDCSNLTSATMPNVTSIETSAFRGCSNLTSATMPNVESIGNYAFYGCSNLTSATMPNVTSIGGSAFYNCGNLTSATMPNVESIETSAFQSCRSLTNLTLSARTNRVSNSAFSICSSLNVIYLPMSAEPSWLRGAFGRSKKAENGTLHVRTDARSTDADDWSGFDGWTIVADL